MGKRILSRAEIIGLLKLGSGIGSVEFKRENLKVCVFGMGGARV